MFCFSLLNHQKPESNRVPFYSNIRVEFSTFDLLGKRLISRLYPMMLMSNFNQSMRLHEQRSLSSVDITE